MDGFLQTLKTQRWDDHRYYHHSLVNQSLHLLSASSFVCAYVLMFWDPWAAALIGWMVSMTSRQIGHFFFEPKGYDSVNQATHEYKEEIKVGYNLRRKAVLLAIWALSPLALYFEPTLFGIVKPYANALGFIRRTGQIWLLSVFPAWFSDRCSCFSSGMCRPGWSRMPTTLPKSTYTRQVRSSTVV